ncbi:DUF4395 domain-containing protein [Microbacterium candidum]|uniref:DUF4395 domain-containing protein n=1 Tax=Microbacterium candidum TaxID=3041922 RepID=A0ABT7N3C5_9MICO|nr:DUF4395 domain-containing protein [Microbacterium sp. ASV49]MDL9981181.1 DUF4395 domain-containing protein [Microbacterium sp. ASV49]
MPDKTPAGIDPRGPRFSAAITSVLLLIDVFLALIDLTDAAFWLLVVIALLFLWGVVAPRTAPWGVVFRKVVRPRLAPPEELEDPRPPRFAQGVGFLVTGLGILLHLLGVPLAIPVAAALAFVAAFLNAAFGYCLGCQIWLLLQRFGIVGREQRAA